MTRSHLRAFAATLVAALYLGGTMLGFAHVIEQRHAVCAEHGALHHVDADTSDVRLSPDDNPRLSAHGWVEDEHCELLHFFRQNALDDVTTASVDVVDNDALLVPTWHPAEAPRFGGERWRIAPKQSPPLTA